AMSTALSSRARSASLRLATTRIEVSFSTAIPLLLRSGRCTAMLALSCAAAISCSAYRFTEDTYRLAPRSRRELISTLIRAAHGERHEIFIGASGPARCRRRWHRGDRPSGLDPELQPRCRTALRLSC